MHHARSGYHGLCLSATFRHQGLITLSTVFSLAWLAGLVSCRQRPWGFPFESFSSPQVARRYRRAAPRLPLPNGPTRPTEVCTVVTNGPASGFVLRRVPCKQTGCLALADAGCSPGFCPFQGFTQIALATASSRLLPHALSSPQLPAVISGASESRSALVLPDYWSRASLLGFCTSTFLAFN